MDERSDIEPAHERVPDDEPHEADGAPEDAGEAVGDDTIREGTVGGLMGGARQSQGQGQGG